jgi:MYXO-CTERM domain-containing protein
VVAFLQQLDGDPKLPRLPFEPPEPEGGAGGAGDDTGGALAASGSGGTTDMAAGAVAAPSHHSGSCAVSLGEEVSSRVLWLLLAPMGALGVRRRRRTKRGGVR